MLKIRLCSCNYLPRASPAIGCLDIVATGTSAADGMLLCRKHRPDLLILDLCLPIAPGATVAEDLMSHSPDSLVIILSAESWPERAQGKVLQLAANLLAIYLVAQPSPIL
ncbi:MAG: DNA-binding response regulator [Synechococcaceae bacterium WB6_3B_236]|nr:DNA-binding response regulator [Synechococcaceae bacterium WB6_3B_236]